jgi:mono/diheme cytochrome c family protein
MESSRILVLVSGAVLAVGTVVLAQQHSYTQAEIDAGARLYESNCGSCHGENGDRITGIDFMKGVFKTAKSDEDMVRIIRNGVPNTGMPPNSFSEEQASNTVAFVRAMLGVGNPNRSLIANLTGDAARGKTIVEGKGNCLSCHAVNGAGATTGPDLAGAQVGGRGGGGGGRGGRGGGGAPAAGAPQRGGGGGAPAAGAPQRGGGGAPVAGAPQRGGGAPGAAGAPRGGGGGGRGGAPVNPQQIERALIDPNAEIAAQYRMYQVVLAKGNATARGTLLNQDTFSVQMRDTDERLMSYWKQDLKEWGFLPSPMPSYKDKLTPQEIADVVSYIVSLRTN